MKRRTRQRRMNTNRPPAIHHDAVPRTLLVVEHAGGFWLVPGRPGVWSARSKLTMSDAARTERWTPARDVTAEWLGVETAPRVLNGLSLEGRYQPSFIPQAPQT